MLSTSPAPRFATSSDIRADVEVGGVRFPRRQPDTVRLEEAVVHRLLVRARVVLLEQMVLQNLVELNGQ